MIKTRQILAAVLLAAVPPTSLSAARGRSQSDLGDQVEAGVTQDSVPGERTVDLPLAGGQRQRVLYASPAPPRATIVMLPGGAGDVGLHRDGDVLRGDNFVVRTRAQWVRLGYAVLIPDTVDRTILRGVGSSRDYAAVV